MTRSEDHQHMARALQLAQRGLCTTHPNPRVGCVIVQDGAVVAEAWHERAGDAHAEVLALQQADQQARGATVYVNMEPCCHQGRTPPCTGFLIDAGVSRVVAAMEDPNPQVASGGITTLREAGIDVDVGVLREQAEVLNRGFVQRMRRRRPWVTLKVAASLDGRTAMASGESKWITSEASRTDVQRLRARYSAILTGIGTVQADDPALTVRLTDIERQPLRVVIDSHLKINKSAVLFDQPGQVLICTANKDRDQTAALIERGADVVTLPMAQERIDLHVLMGELAARGVNELLVEAGRTLSGALLQARLVDELVVYLAPTLMGDTGRGMFRIPGLKQLKDRVTLEITDWRWVGDDMRVTLRPQES